MHFLSLIQKMTQSFKSKNIVIAHLDLGIGGAEQLVVHIAKLVKDSGHQIRLLTTHHDCNHCFEETKPNGVLGPHIEVYGDWIPRNVFGRFHAFFAILRMVYLAFIIVFVYSTWADLIILDGVSAPVPILKYFGGFKVLFYCHFPDLLLCTDRATRIKKIYRMVVDGIEEYTTGLCDMILVNSKFTASIVAETFPSILKKHRLQVLYPSIKAIGDDCLLTREQAIEMLPYCAPYSHIFVSLNRYERKKRVEVAIEAIHSYLSRVSTSENRSTMNALLVIAGGYDKKVSENVEYLKELQENCVRYGLVFKYFPESLSELSSVISASINNQKNSLNVVFRTSISSAERGALFSVATGLLYTPDREHFGIVPLEAMQLGLPVIAVNTGGPTETIRHQTTGYLCRQSGEDFADCMLELVSDSQKRFQMQVAAKQWANEQFSELKMQNYLNKYVAEVTSNVDSMCN